MQCTHAPARTRARAHSHALARARGCARSRAGAPHAHTLTCTCAHARIRARTRARENACAPCVPERKITQTQTFARISSLPSSSRSCHKPSPLLPLTPPPHAPCSADGQRAVLRPPNLSCSFLHQRPLRHTEMKQSMRAYYSRRPTQ